MKKPRMRIGGYHFSDKSIKEYVENLDKEVDNGYNPYKHADVGEQDFLFCYGIINSDLLLTFIKYGNVSLNNERVDSCVMNLAKHMYEKNNILERSHDAGKRDLTNFKMFETKALQTIMKSLEKECGFKFTIRIIDNPARLKTTKSGGIAKHGKLLILEKISEDIAND